MKIVLSNNLPTLLKEELSPFNWNWKFNLLLFSILIILSHASLRYVYEFESMPVRYFDKFLSDAVRLNIKQQFSYPIPNDDSILVLFSSSLFNLPIKEKLSLSLKFV